MSVPAFKLKANANSRVLSGHPWVFANDGEAVECRDRMGRLLGTGICNGRSQIVWRRLSRERVALDEGYLAGALERSISRRAAGGFRRLVWSESDDLPGVVADQYGDAVVVQIQTLAMERRSALIGDLLDRVLRPADVIFRNDAHIRKLEGLELETHTRSGAAWEPRWASIDGLETWL